jgi:predicted DNA-binding transcriptional regulator YafY
LKIDRLVAILVLLLRKEKVQAKELAERFDVSVRTILRDVEALNLAGIPVVTYQGSGGGIGLAEGYRLDKSVLTGDEMAAVITALKGFDAAIDGSSHEILMEKLQNALPPSQLALLDTRLRQFVIDLSPWHDDTLEKERLAVIRQAIHAACMLDLSYLDTNGKRSDRKVEPYSLILKGNIWYLFAWCTLRGGFRYFRISRIRSLKETGERYQPRELPQHPAPDESEWTKKLIPLELKFSPQMESIVADWFGGDMQTCADGWILVKTAYPEENWLYGFLLSFGAELEVVNPPHIRCILAEIAHKIVQKYSDQT